jgi:hypothetical protein
MGIFQKIHRGIERWLHAEEIEQMQQAPQPTDEERAMLESIKRQIQIIKVDFEKSERGEFPNGNDIERYYEYHKRFVDHRNETWGAGKLVVIDKTLFVIEATEKGWDYLRENCGMTQPKPWSTSGNVWKAQ